MWLCDTKDRRTRFFNQLLLGSGLIGIGCTFYINNALIGSMAMWHTLVLMASIVIGEAVQERGKALDYINEIQAGVELFKTGDATL